MRALLLPIVALFGAVAAGAPQAEKIAAPRYSQMSDARRAEWVEQARAIADTGARIERLSAPFLGTPYRFSPLGEGEGVDADPRIRWDEADCLTFVETTMALALSSSPEHVLETLDAIRYAAPPPSFQNRNHFTEAQWIPHNVLHGRLRDVTRRLGGARTVKVVKEFGPDVWKARGAHWKLALAADGVPRGRFPLDVLPLDAVRALASSIPAGTLLFVVRKDVRTAPTVVSHLGFVLDTTAGRVVRHASSIPFNRVVDEPLAKFIDRNTRFDRWPVVGFAFFQLRLPDVPVAQVPGAP